ncbi:hypothetical protein GUITHDRAFT_155894 [Guillardia theta CCMP2712]|uniref:FYVE-type domain-containing protein n=1 Tax=Guillardia theta (strain CCMP2712) TaxID=905079 RepID=L1IDE8_GUITC|nr:hypothetical protein GUITHDRAFT_155894 [Guillardia theta CCMP2712]EKX33939.1 hypothetical protein GUITHDRAFT_155894 [Guillardia theta CCMP2712]|eukprot:XP_005820919.1 hypothetical protein GUITHDRAFT_155894 [Guillardia theta CCMP2712]
MSMETAVMEPQSSTTPDSPSTRSRRQIPRHLWQPDGEADRCSIASCSSTFNKWTIGVSGRHHCRVCGRVVCQQCSRGTINLLPSNGGRASLARPVRVCDACRLTHGKVELKPSYFVSILSTMNAMTTNFRRRKINSTLISSAPALARSSSSSDLGQNVDVSSVMPTLRHSASAPCLLSSTLNMEELAHSNPSVTGQSDDEHSHAETPNSTIVQGHEQGSCNMLNPSLPLQIPSGTGQLKSNQATKPDNDKNAGQKMEELVGGSDHVSKRLKVLKEALEKFSFYEGLLQHEPAALRALLVAEAGGCLPSHQQ